MDTNEQLRKIRSQVLGVIEEISASPKPSYSVDGQSVSWSDYLKQLRETASWCDRQLAALEEPFEIRSVVDTEAGMAG